MQTEVTPIKGKPKEISKELEDLKKMLAALSSVHNLLQQGHFTWAHREQLAQSLAFLEGLHHITLDQAVAHKDVDLDEELKAIKDKQVEQKAALKKAKKRGK